MKSIMKISKKFIKIGVAVAVVCATGVGIYAKGVYDDVKATQVAYHAIDVATINTSKFNKDEKQTFERLLAERDDAFNFLQVSRIEENTLALKKLTQESATRIEQEAVTKIRQAVEKVDVPSDSNDTETTEFNKLKKSVIATLSKKETTLDVAKKEQKKLLDKVTSIEKAVKKRQEQASSTSSYDNSGYADNSDSYNSYNADGYIDHWYSGGYSGRYIEPSYEPTPPPTPEPTPPVSSGESCTTMPDGSTECWGGDW